MIKGGDIDNAVVIIDHKLNDTQLKELAKKIGVKEKISLGENGILNNKQLRFRNEPVRHKLLDLIGDLALIGAPLKAQILAARPGHKANVEFAKQVRKLYQQKKLLKKFQLIKKEGVVFDANAIERILPHRYPFLLVDKIIELEIDKRVVGVKSVTANEPFFQGHFPDFPVMPGVLIVESMAQLGAILAFYSVRQSQDEAMKGELNKYIPLFTGIEEAKFRRPVVPGDTLRIELNVIKQRGTIWRLSGQAFVEDKLATEAVIQAILQKRTKI